MSTPDLYAVADFCLIPIGTADPSVAEYIAECQRILEKSGLKYKRTSEGPWAAVSQAIHDCHAAVHAQGAPRVATDIRIGTRVDRVIQPGTGNDAKVHRVEEILQKEKDAAA
ncbi:YkoF-like protein [Mycena sp. CBHHK59/15]|nr:YkoF-like protein [Mycena sp. CBHHK59/15]